MTESKHRPGPWRQGVMGTVVCDTPSGRPSWDESGHVAYYGGHLVAESIASPADAALIARAPDLLREVEELRAQNAEMLDALEAVRALAENDMCGEVIAAVDAAIATAKGGAS